MSPSCDNPGLAKRSIFSLLLIMVDDRRLVLVIVIIVIDLNEISEANKQTSIFPHHRQGTPPLPRRSRPPNARRNPILTTLITLITPTAPARNSTHTPTRTRNERQTTSRTSSPTSLSINTASLLSQLTIDL